MAFAANTDSRCEQHCLLGPDRYRSPSGRHSVAEDYRRVSVSVGLLPPLSIVDATDHADLLCGSLVRGSLNQILDCDPPNKQPAEDITNGCQTPTRSTRRNLESATT